jgi:hypothetical protein
MRAASSLLIVILCATCVTAQSAQKKTGAAAPEPQARQAAPTVTNDADAEAMRADLAQMRNLVGQMQRNLGFVDSGLTPLKHQFELEIEMWNVLINDMQRRLNARAPRIGPAANPPAPPQ